MNDQEFQKVFKALTGKRPLSWQVRLFREHFLTDKLPHILDLPTGLGKTMVIAVWLIARSVNETLPRRLIYVVDRRTVVDQATDVVENLRDKAREALPSLPEFFVSTLRGQLADNREWSRDPSCPAIVVGTVDLIGSALLFSGYRSSFKRRPLEAGLLGQDSLLVLDEAHLSAPFEKLVCAIGKEGPFQRTWNGEPQGAPMRVIRMSATSGRFEGSESVFTLKFDKTGDLADEDAADEVVRERFNAKKCLSVVALGEKDKLNRKLADIAVELAENVDLVGKRIVVFVRRPDDAKAVANAIREHVVVSADKSGSKPKGVKNAPYAAAVEVLTGTMRGLERDELVEKSVLKRFLDGDEEPGENNDPVFLVSTSAGEVGFDLNADHLVGDEAPLDSWIQRLGRVNRRGKGDAKVILVRASQPADKTDFDKACAATTTLVGEHLDGQDVCPKALAEFRKTLTPEEAERASSPKPTTVELTDILLDAWSLTSITDRMPGRPEVGPWLRGIDEEQAQTTIAWRAELQLFRSDPSPEKALQAVFAKHPIRPHESLTVNTGRLVEFLKKISKLKDLPEDLITTRVAVRLPRGQVVCRTLQQLTDNSGVLYADSTLILPATFGGLDAAGMLDAESISNIRKDSDPKPPSLDVADHDGYEQTAKARSRLRILIERSEDGSWTPKPLPGLTIPEDVALDACYDKSTELFNDLKAAGLRVRLVQPIEFDEKGDCVQSLVVLAPAPRTKDKEDQPLAEHVGAVKAGAERIVKELKLAESDPVRIGLLFAAKWHDEGKKARIWQVFANNPDPDGAPLGKMAQARDPKWLRGYRHEFGSLLRIYHPERCGTVGCNLPADPAARDLALHLIATHHGMARPHFSMAVYENFTDAERDAVHADIIRRFGRLQRKYGWWRLAWLENLLRCSDALASADDEVTEIDEAEGAEA